MASKRGSYLLFVLIILNAIAFVLVPWENWLFNKEEVINNHSEYLEEVDVKYLEPTGVYVVMDFSTEHIKGYQNPNWFHRKMSAYAQFYMYTGPITEEMRRNLWTYGEDVDALPVLIADTIIEIPESGTVMIDMTSRGDNGTYVCREALETLQKDYPQVENLFFDSATPYCEELMAFKKAQQMNCLYAAIIEAMLYVVIMIIVAVVSRSKKKKQNVKPAK